ncbi:MAG: ketopantoate reductase family protein [Candidatus Aenigmarchaeota archaeon]|nr:ketopantoate reductase family protein [Candidatus Aenigmarchaeota archaeon]
MIFNKIFILGAGSVGSIYGALLSKQEDVNLIGRKEHVNAINSKGLLLYGNFEGKYNVKADTEIKEIPSNTLILLSTKITDSEKSIKEIKHLIKKDTIILLLQNGLGIEEIVKKILPDNEIIRAVITLGSDFLEPGKISNVSYSNTAIEKTKNAEKIAKLFNDCGLKTEVSDDIKSHVWKKLIVNCVLNPLTTILQVKDNEIIVNNLKPIRYGIIDECIKVAKTEGIYIDPSIKNMIDERIALFTNYSSMCQDIMKAKKTEIDFLNGKIVEIGKKHNIPTPMNETMVASIKFLEEKNEHRRN